MQFLPRKVAYLWTATLFALSANVVLAKGFDGHYYFENGEIEYFVPPNLIGFAPFTGHHNKYTKEGEPIFFTVFTRSIDGKAHPNFVLSLQSTQPLGPWDENLPAYIGWYKNSLVQMGARCDIDVVVVNTRKWLLQRQYTAAGKIARISFVTKINDKFNLICAMGLAVTTATNVSEKESRIWLNLLESVTQRITIKSR